MRSAAALLVGAGSSVGGSITAAYQPIDAWHTGSASLVPGGSAAAAAAVLDAVLGDQDMPPASPGPASARMPAADAEAETAAEQEEGAGGIPADHPLLQMEEEERLLHLHAQVGGAAGAGGMSCRWRCGCGLPLTSTFHLHPASQVMSEVRGMLGHAVQPDEPLMTAGLDSRGGMELRRALADSLGMQASKLPCGLRAQGGRSCIVPAHALVPPLPTRCTRPNRLPASQLPVTLLYDYQSVSAVVDYINGAITDGALAAAAAPGGGSGDGSGSDAEDAAAVAQRQPRGAAAGPGAALDGKPSDLLKMLRPPQAPRPLFLAAPGVANAQSAYFSFAQFLQARACVLALLCCL